MQPIKHPIARIFIHIALWLVVLYSTIPFVWTLLNSLKTKKQAQARTPLFWFKPNLDSFSRLWLDKVPDNFTTLVYWLIAILLVLVLISVFAKHLPVSRRAIYLIIVGTLVLILWAIPRVVETAEFYDYFINTIIICVGAVVISVGIGSLSAYGLARYVGLAGVVLILLALAFRSLPRLAFVLPYYWMGQISGLYDTHILLIITLAAVNQPFTIYMLRSFFMDIPREIEESAMIDGASRFQVWRQIMMPNIKPGIASLAIFAFISGWNAYLIPFTFTIGRAGKTAVLSVYLQNFQGDTAMTNWNMVTAVGLFQLLPVMLFFIFTQEYLLKIYAGGAKGGV